MKRIFLFLAAIPVTVTAVVTCGQQQRLPTEQIATAALTPSDDLRVRRLLTVAADAPSMPQRRRQALLDQSDDIRNQLKEEGEDDAGSALRTRLHEVEVSEEEAYAWYEEHRPLFGDRTFEQSRTSVDRLIAIALVRKELGID